MFVHRWQYKFVLICALHIISISGILHVIITIELNINASTHLGLYLSNT